MIESLVELFSKFPQFYCMNNNKNVFKGTFIIEDSPCSVEIFLPNFPNISNFKCILKNNLHCVNISNKTCINPNWNVEEFLNHLPKIWQQVNANLILKNELDYGKGILNILNQILACKDELKDIKMHVNDDLTLIKFDNFIEYMEHYLELDIQNFIVKVKDHSLPNFSDDWKDNMEPDDELSTKKLFSSSSTILGYLKQFLKLLENFELFYKYLNALDDLCWIVEPAIITTKYDWRMFKLLDNVYIKVTLNPLSPNSISVNLYGPTLEVEKYRDIYQNNVEKWDCELDVYNNLLKIFDLMLFPCKDTTSLENDDMSCKICLCYLDDDGHVPICSCDNTKCNLLYHVSCLKRWFSSSAEGRTFLSVAIGICPFCKEKLSASFKSLVDI